MRGPTYIVIPNIDLVQEFKVVGHDAKAEFGGAAGGIVNLVSKSGGNSFHGSAFWYVRSDDDNIFVRYTEQRVSVFNPIGEACGMS